MFDQLFKRASTRARYVTAPFAEERARYLDYCELRGDSRSQQLRKAHDLLWIARKLNSHTELQVTSDQIRALVVNGQHDGDTAGPNLNLLLMLFAIYGLRESEVAKLRLDDIDWEHDQLRIPRAKRREPQVYPLLPSVGRALTDYLLSVRRSTSHREIFLTLVSPYCPLSRSGLYDMVAARLKSLNVQCAHHGPHSLRHACAARLVAQGLSLKEIGDHLGHRSTSATRVYAKVDLLGLREVAAFDLGELS